MIDSAVPAELQAAYARCRQLTREHGTTYFWATQLLPARCRPHVYALYGFCRLADDIVDSLGASPREGQAEALASLGDQLRRALRGHAVDPTAHPVVAAVAHTAGVYSIDPTCFERFLRSMTMDLVVDRYQTWDDLLEYMDGSAAVIGEMMLPILEPVDRAAFGPARQLGRAFQLTNFLRDVGEDLDRGRVYIPQDDLRRFDADPWTRAIDDSWRRLMAFEIERARQLYDLADDGIALLPAWSARSIATARTLYARILNEIEANDYDVFRRRARVSTTKKVLLTARLALARARSGRSARGRAAVAGLARRHRQAAAEPGDRRGSGADVTRRTGARQGGLDAETTRAGGNAQVVSYRSAVSAPERGPARIAGRTGCRNVPSTQ